MKKLLIASFALLFCLQDVGKKETPAASTTTSEPLQSTFPFWTMPKEYGCHWDLADAEIKKMGRNRFRPLLIKVAVSFWPWPSSKKRPVGDELKTFIENGLEETQKALLEAEEKMRLSRGDANWQDLHWKPNSARPRNPDHNWLMIFKFRCQKKASQLEYLKYRPWKSLKNRHNQYIADRVANGTTEHRKSN